MKIKITNLSMTNFKCFRNKEITFEKDVTTISGRNGAGKTTIADAILWCLFGKNSQGQSDFDLKTHDENGKPIPNLDHSVEVVLDCDGSTITLKRTLKETWVKKRGSDEQVFKNNTTEYLVNGELKTAADYKKYIAQLVDEEVFKAITNPSYFPSLKWQSQREFLSRLAGHVDIEDENDEFKVLLACLELEKSDITAYRKHLSYQIKQIKDKLDKIPVRLEEQNKALPELLDWDSLNVQYADVTQHLQDLEAKILSIRSGGGNEVRKAELRCEYENFNNKSLEIQEQHRKALQARRMERDDMIAEASRKFNSLLNDQHDFENLIKSFDNLTYRCQETLEQCEKDKLDIRTKWAENEAHRFQWEDGDSVCPVCGQFLPAEQLQEKKQKAFELFNKQKADTKEALTERATKVKAVISDTESQIEALNTKKAEAEKNLELTKEAINNAFAEKAKLEKEPLPSFEETLRADKEYQTLAKRCSELLEQMEQSSVSSEEDANTLAALEDEKSHSASLLKQIQGQLATRSQYDKIIALIDGINNEQKDLVCQLSELERKEDVARRYQDRQNAILESRINEHFTFVKWRMFRTVNNGGDPFDEPFCECYVDGVAYHDGLNQAARLNAGLDIINALCNHYNVSAPIILDNAESTINILQTIGQQIRLYVTDKDLEVL